MQLFTRIDQWRAARHALPAEVTLGFVPTMGNLHPGHGSLLIASRQANECTLASIFVNPTQFNQAEDFTNYPRTLAADLALLEQHGVDYCLLPDVDSLYADHYHYKIQENVRAQLMEGAHRPGHFAGMLTVVMKLLNLTRPHRAYFGEKDYQQLQLIQAMVSCFFMEIEIKACPTIRESSGLAYSSRNARLTREQRERADQFAKIFHQGLSSAAIITALKRAGISVEYIEEHQGRRFAAVKIGNVRLIDNYRIEAPSVGS